MPKYTFRTEGPNDNVGAEFMINELKMTIVKHWTEDDGPPGWHLHFYTVEADYDLGTLSDKMQAIVDDHNQRFSEGKLSIEDLPCVDLHRCAQTLNYGDECKGPYEEPFNS